MPETKYPHTLEECPQGPVLAALQRSMDDYRDISKRIVKALEDIARHSERGEHHEKRLDAGDKLFDDLFHLHRDLEVKIDNISTRMDEACRKIEARVVKIELRHAEEVGEERVEAKIEKKEERKRKFWDGVKVNLAPNMAGLVFFVFWLCAHYGVLTWISRAWHEFTTWIGG